MAAATYRLATPAVSQPRLPAAAAKPPAHRRTRGVHNNRAAAYDFGCDAERSVALYLFSGGYDILGRRVRLRGGEVDIVACRDDVVTLVEVKARRNTWDGLSSVDHRKQRRLSRAADEWLSRNERYGSCTIRFDIALVSRGGEIEYLENAFDFVPADDFVL